jgi:MMPL family
MVPPIAIAVKHQHHRDARSASGTTRGAPTVRPADAVDPGAGGARVLLAGDDPGLSDHARTALKNRSGSSLARSLLRHKVNTVGWNASAVRASPAGQADHHRDHRPGRRGHGRMAEPAPGCQRASTDEAIGRLVDQAQAEGLSLTGPGGLRWRRRPRAASPTFTPSRLCPESSTRPTVSASRRDRSQRVRRGGDHPGAADHLAAARGDRALGEPPARRRRSRGRGGLDRPGRHHGRRCEGGGSTAAVVDFSRYTADRLPWFIAAVLVLSFILLTVVFRSILMPLKAVIMNLLSVGAAYGILVAVFQWGWGPARVSKPCSSSRPTASWLSRH